MNKGSKNSIKEKGNQMRRDFQITIVILAVLAFISCASFKEFTAEYDQVSPFMLKDGTGISIDQMNSGWLVGSWKYTEAIQHTRRLNEVIIAQDPQILFDYSIDVLGNDLVKAKGETGKLSEFLNANFGRTDERHQITVHDLKASPDYRKVVMVKIETETEADGTKDSYIYVRTLIRVSSSYTFIVSFDSDGGTSVAPQTVALGETASVPPVPSRKGFIFNGWFSSGESYDFNGVIFSNITLKASWDKEQPKEFTVSFDSDGGSAVSSEVTASGIAVARPESPDKTGFIFAGWMNGDVAYDFAVPVTSDLNLKAKWETKVETYAPNFFDTKFFYSQCKDVQWYVSEGKLNMSSPTLLYSASTSTQLSEEDLSDGAYIRFGKTDENGLYSQTLYSKEGTVKMVLSVKGRITYFGDYGFLYKADPNANNASTEFCSYFYTNKGLNPDGTTPAGSSFAYVMEEVSDDAVLEGFSK